MLRRDHLKGLAVGAVGVVGFGAYGILSEDDEEDDGNTPVQDRSFEDLQDGDWHANVRFESPIDGLDADVFQAGSMADGSLQSTIEIEGGVQYSAPDVVTIRGMEFAWLMGDSAVADEATVSFDSAIELSNDDACEQPRHSDFEVAVSASGVQGADRLVITVPESKVSITSTC